MGKFILQYRLSLTTESICLCATINYLITPILANLCLKGRLDLGGEKKILRPQTDKTFLLSLLLRQNKLVRLSKEKHLELGRSLP
jgi:hypothetical protein